MRLGKYSGNIYTDEEAKTAGECCTIITAEQAKDKNFIKDVHLKDLAWCCKCHGCPKSME